MGTTSSTEHGQSLNIKKHKILDLEDKKCIYIHMQGAYQSLDYPAA